MLIYLSNKTEFILNFFTVQSQQKAQIKIGKYCHNVAETEKIQEFRVEKKYFSQKLYSTSWKLPI